MRVKICGITNIDDALAAIEAGADALGFVFAESPRKVSAATVCEALSKLPPFITTVGVFANQDADEITEIMARTHLHFAQVHGSTRIPFGGRSIRALRVKSADDIRRAANDESVTSSSAVLLDTHVEGLMGGTGRTFDWDLAVEARSLGKPIILAGGLTLDNVAEAVRRVRPYAVDVSTGVEASPGKKDHSKIKEFIHNAKSST